MRLVPSAGRLALLSLFLPAAAAAQGPNPASCVLGTSQADLSANNVSARVFNTGSLFYGNATNDGSGYLVPRATQKSAIFASGLWIGGKVGGTLRVAGGTYGPTPGMDFTFWPGPLDNATGRPVNPSSCAAFDRIYSVRRSELVAAATGGSIAPDIAAWPVQLGAPYFVDTNANGRRDAAEPSISRGANDPGYGVNGTQIDVAARQLPDIVGDQGIWWLMNDVGNVHPAQATAPLGIEVQVLAFSFDRPDALGDATFYRYTLINKGGVDITDAYVSVFSDPDLGDANDDYIGSDPAAGLGYVYNADNQDGPGTGPTYGAAPPAVGYDFFQGPIVNGDTLGATAFSYFQNAASGGNTDPKTGVAMYNFMQGLWGDGSPMRAFGSGFQQTQGAVTTFAFPGDPETNESWSEFNPGTGLPSNPPGDRRFALHTGPFTLVASQSQDIVFGIVYARGLNNLASITALRAADALAQQTFDNAFVPPPVAGEASPEAQMALGAPTPNPFSAETRVAVGATGGSVRAVLFDVLGRQVAVVHDGPLSGDLVVPGADLVPGLYVLRVTTPAGERSVRIVRR